MYSRNSWEKRNGGYTVPAGYDGSRFRRRRRDSEGNTPDEVILVPDSGFAQREDELSVGGIPTQKGINKRRNYSALAENTADLPSSTDDPPMLSHRDDTVAEASSSTGEKLSGILGSLGFGDRISTDELLLCAIIFIIASDTENEGRNVGDILLILALLLGIR